MLSGTSRTFATRTLLAGVAALSATVLVGAGTAAADQRAMGFTGDGAERMVELEPGESAHVGSYRGIAISAVRTGAGLNLVETAPGPRVRDFDDCELLEVLLALDLDDDLDLLLGLDLDLLGLFGDDEFDDNDLEEAADLIDEDNALALFVDLDLC